MTPTSSARAAFVLLALCLPAAAAAQPGDAELAAMRAAPAAEWRPHIRTDTLVVQSWVAPRGAETVMWMRARYTTPRSFAGQAYDTRYTRYVADCERRQTRYTRMVWTLGATVAADTPVAGRPADVAPGSVAAAMLAAACAHAAPSGAGADPAPDVAMLMVLPSSRWVALGGSPGRTQHADLEGATAEDGLRLVWLRVLLDEPQRVSLGTFDAMYQRWMLDCAGERVRMGRLVLALADRVIADSVVPLDWVQPRPATVTHTVLDRVCAGARAAGPPAPAADPRRTIARARALLANRMEAARDPAARVAAGTTRPAPARARVHAGVRGERARANAPFRSPAG